jgi:thiol:disulfide interchange protein DsbC|tara:strand:- start:175 stop:867 length:693 start_codon:yes stop_codon:yes gene_type:complete
MKIIITIILFSFSLLVFSDEKELQEKINQSYPDLVIKSIQKTDFNNLYEVLISGQIIYTNKDFSFLIVEGRVVDPETKIDLTSDRLDELTRVNFLRLPFDKAIKVVRGNGERKVAVFSDVDCPFCKKLEKEGLSELDNITIYTFLFPLAIHPKAEIRSKKIWCAEDKEKAWNDYMLRNIMANNNGNCKTPIEDILVLGRDLGISSTPTIIFSSGKKIPGAIPLKEIEKHI